MVRTHARNADRNVTALYAELGPVIYARCRRLLRDDAAAEDATQEVFVRALTHLDPALPREDALAWLQRISTNHCLDLLRRRRRHAEDFGLPVEATSHAPSPEHRVAQRDLLQKVVRHSNPALTEAARLYHLEGLEQVTIAERLSVSRRTVINRLQAFAARAREVAGLDEVREVA